MRRIHTTASLTALLLLCVALSRHSFAAAAWPALPDLTAFLMLRTEAGKSQSLITIEKAADGLKDYDVILFGEFHDHAGNHLAEMQLFRAVFAREPKLARGRASASVITMVNTAATAKTASNGRSRFIRISQSPVGRPEYRGQEPICEGPPPAT